jgi:hypothetical protein
MCALEFLHPSGGPDFFNEFKQLRGIHLVGKVRVWIALPHGQETDDSAVYEGENRDALLARGQVLQVRDRSCRPVVEAAVATTDDQNQNIGVALDAFAAVVDG